MSIIEFSKILLVGFGGVVAIAYYITHIAESGINQNAKSKLTNIVKNFKATPTIRHSLITFTMLSDHVFGDRIFSFRAVITSCLISLLWILVVTITCSVMFPTYTYWFEQANFFKVIVNSAIPILIMVLLIDYISVSITRLFIRNLKTRSFLGLLWVLIIDFIIAATLFYIGITGIKYLLINPIWLSVSESLPYWYKVDSLPTALVTLNDLTSDMLVKRPDGSTDIKGGLLTEVVYAFPEGVAFYSSLLTSIWLWIHIISYTVFKFAVQTDSIKSKLLKIVNIDEKPFSALAAIIVILYIPISLIVIGLFAGVSAFHV